MKTTVFFILIFCGFSASANPVWQRSNDQRTQLPEKLENGHKDWGFNLGAGYSQFSGNVEATSANAEMTYFKYLGQNSFYANSGFIYGLSNGNVNQNQGRLAFRYDMPVTDKFKWFAFNTHAYNKFLKLDYRTTVGAGPWYDFEGEGWKNGVSAAPAYFYEDFNGYEIERDLWISLRNNYALKLNDYSSFGFDFFYMFRANNSADQLTFFQPYFETVIKPDRFTLKLSYVAEGDTRPKPGVKSTDFNYFATLVMHFGE